MVSTQKKKDLNTLYMVWNTRDMLTYLLFIWGEHKDILFEETTKLICTRASVGANIKR